MKKLFFFAVVYLVLTATAFAADRYRVLAGNWNLANSWSTTSGGAGGASVPTNSDNVFFDANTPVGTHTVNVAATTLSLNFTGFTGTFAGSSTLNIAGSLTMGAGMTRTFSGVTTFSATTTGNVLRFNGIMYGAMNFAGVGGEWILQDTFNSNGTTTLTSGTFDTNSQAVTNISFYTSNANIRTLKLGSSTITATSWTIGTTTNLTFNAGSSALIIQSTTNSFSGGGLAYYDVFIPHAGTSMAGQRTFTGNNTFNNLTISGDGTTDGSASILLGGNQTVNGIFSCLGLDATTRKRIYSDTPGTQRTITAAVVQISNTDFQDVTAAGTGSWTGSSLADGGNNSGITFTTPVTRFWVGNGGSWSASGHWSTTSGGSGGASVPLIHDNVIFDSNSFSVASQSININRNVGNFDASNVTNNPNFDFSTSARHLFGDFVLSPNCSVSGGILYTYKAVGTFNINTAGVNINANTFVVDHPSSNLVFSGNSVFGGTLTLTRGQLDANDFNVTCLAFSSNTTNNPTVNMGNGIWDLTGTGTVWSISGNINFTLNSESSTIRLTNTSATARTFSSNSTQSVGNVSIVAGSGTVNLTNLNCNDLNFTGFAGTWTGGDITVRGNFILSPNMTVNPGGATKFAGSGTKSIVSNGKSTNAQILFDGPGSVWILQDNFHTTRNWAVNLTSGTLDLNGMTFLTEGQFTAVLTNTKGLIFNDGTLEVRRIDAGTSAWTWSGGANAANTDLIFEGGGRIKVSGSTINPKIFNGNGEAFPDLIFENSSAGTLDLRGNNSSFNSIQIIGSGNTIRFADNISTTVGALSIDGIAGSPNYIQSLTSGAPHYLIKQGEGTISVNNVSIRDSRASPESKFFSLISNGNLDSGNNTGWIFQATTTSDMKSVNGVLFGVMKKFSSTLLSNTKALNAIE